MIVFQLISWFCVIALAHSYLIYPLLLKILAGSRSAKETDKRRNGEIPSVSILIAAYNEEKVIKEKLESIFNSEYPKEKIEVLVGSDASTDRTNDIVRTFPGVQLVEFNERNGKVKIINQLKSLAKHDILVLTDANVLFDKNAIQELVKHFDNPEIALVDSNMINIKLQNKGVSKAESTYIRGEVEVKYNEGKIFGTMMGPFGGCYAVRKSYYEDVPENFLVDDFYINMKVLEKGGKAISEPKAFVYEEIHTNWKVEFKRKVRIAAGSYQNLQAFSHLLFKFDKLSFCFLSHKVLRWLGPLFILDLYFSNMFITLLRLNQDLEAAAITGHFVLHYYGFQIFFMFQNLVVFLFILDILLRYLGINFLFSRLVTHFLTTNIALVAGFFKFVKGVRSSVWQPTKR